MRKSTGIILIALMFGFVSTHAQFSIGVKSDIIFNDVELESGSINLDQTIKPLTGYGIGVFGTYDLDDNLTLKTELLYKHTGFEINESTSFGVFGFDVPIGATLRTTVNYIELPVMLRYNYNFDNLRAYVEAGPSINYSLNGKLETVANSILDFNLYSTDLNFGSDSFNRTNIAGQIGAGVVLPFSEGIEFTAGIEYAHDLTSSAELPVINSRIKNNSWNLGVGVSKRF